MTGRSPPLGPCAPRTFCFGKHVRSNAAVTPPRSLVELQLDKTHISSALRRFRLLVRTCEDRGRSCPKFGQDSLVVASLDQLLVQRRLEVWSVRSFFQSETQSPPSSYPNAFRSGLQDPTPLAWLPSHLIHFEETKRRAVSNRDGHGRRNKLRLDCTE